MGFAQALQQLELCPANVSEHQTQRGNQPQIRIPLIVSTQLGRVTVCLRVYIRSLPCPACGDITGVSN